MLLGSVRRGVGGSTMECYWGVSGEGWEVVPWSVTGECQLGEGWEVVPWSVTGECQERGGR